MSILILIVGLLIFIGLIVSHEFGHFIMARRGGVEVEEFGIFFPPRLYKRTTKNGWVFSFNLTPLGGFVKLKGEHDSDTEPGSFGAASLWVKSKIMAAGVVVNLLTGLVLLTILALVGMPKFLPNQFTVKSDTRLTTQEVLISDIAPGSPAAKSGLKTNDVITDIGQPGYSPVAVNDFSKLPNVTKSFEGKSVIIYYLRNGQHHEAKATLLSSKMVAASKITKNPKGYLGIVPTQYDMHRSTWSAPIVAIGLSGQVISLTFQGLGHALAGFGGLIAGLVTHNNVARQNGQAKASSQVGGPIAITYIVSHTTALGWNFMLFIMAIIALTLGFMNILPIPPLDGGKLWPTLITHAIGRPFSAEREEIVNLVGFIFIGTIFILISLNDIQRFILH